MKILDGLTKLKKPDLVISDYEPVSARLAYALDIPLVTIDQQSKFLGKTWDNIKNLNPLDEQMRLRMFFLKQTLE